MILTQMPSLTETPTMRQILYGGFAEIGRKFDPLGKRMCYFWRRQGEVPGHDTEGLFKVAHTHDPARIRGTRGNRTMQSGFRPVGLATRVRLFVSGHLTPPAAANVQPYQQKFQRNAAPISP